MHEKKLTIFVGNLGSGKTEIALNFALFLVKQGYPTTIVDLDIINPYFRTRMVRHVLEHMGLKVVCPRGELANADLPSLSPAIQSVLEDSFDYGVFDVGGDEIGATILGRYKTFLLKDSYALYYVINQCRPFTRDKASIIKNIHFIEKSARLKITGLVSNTNLGWATDIETIFKGHEVVKTVAAELDLPVAFLSIRRDLMLQVSMRLNEDIFLLPLEIFMQPPWYYGITDPLLKIPQTAKEIPR